MDNVVCRDAPANSACIDPSGQGSKASGFPYTSKPNVQGPTTPPAARNVPCVPCQAPLPLPQFDKMTSHAKGIFENGYKYGLLTMDVQTASPLGIDFRMDGKYQLCNQKVDAYIESIFRLCDWNLNFTERWNTDNTLSTDLSLSDLFFTGIRLGAGSKYSMETGSKMVYLRTGYELGMGKFQVVTTVERPTSTMKPSLVVGMAGVIAGGSLTVDMCSRKAISHSFGVGYNIDGFILNSNVKDFTEFEGSVYQKFKNNLETGIRMAWNMGSVATEFQLGAVYRMDERSTFRAKVDNQNRVGLALSQHLFGGMLVHLSACIDGKNLFHGFHQIGIGIDMLA